MNKLYLVGGTLIDSDSWGDYDTTIILAESPEQAIEIAKLNGVMWCDKAIELDMSEARIVVVANPEPDWNSDWE